MMQLKKCCICLLYTSGRSDDMLIIRGVNVFPTQIESVILEMAEFEPHYLLIVGRENNTDTIDVYKRQA